ncbi:uncharacterized protein BX664DRAFT_319924 [Halteromyces radiatus]|uniref:uncharacterized protein n=1 Tax=Halteromyces radiatus TaxID=101107 RepID=UPI002220FBD0|nr:uncharacterized protein BX664DRAFT_319924 [Halteromyces radiatus]KAI8098917.1 hypothetical protein BX664DRAFT_319924 [Halteromyces radiatus]
MVPVTKISSDIQQSSLSWKQDQNFEYWDSEFLETQGPRPKKTTGGSYSTPLQKMPSSTDIEKRLEFLQDMEKAKKQLALFRQEMKGLETQMNDISENLHESKNRVYEIEQDLTETQEDNVNLQVLLERAVKSQKESDIFATQAIRNIHSDLNMVVRENNQLQERLSSIEYIQREHKGNVHDMVTRMREYVYMLEQAQDTIQLMQESTTKQSSLLGHDIDVMSVSMQDLSLDSRRTSETSSYITEEDDIGILVRKESQTTEPSSPKQQSTIPSTYITSHPRIVHKRASFPTFLPSPVLTPQKDFTFLQSQTIHASSDNQSRQQTQKSKISKSQQQGLLLLLND